jgi:site-specific DNA-adenine methylase
VIEITYIKNPFNYIGAKYKLLPQILPLFPDNIDTFVDLFGGSGEVGLNVKADRVVYNDKCEALVNILNNLDSVFVTEVEDTISKWGVIKTWQRRIHKIQSVL